MENENKDFWKNHQSYAKEHHLKSNESLSTLGDSVLDLIVAEYFYEKNYSSGQITLERSKIVSDRNLAKIAKKIGFDKKLRLGKGTEKLGGRDHIEILEQIVEAYIGFIYLNEGLEVAREFVKQTLIEID